MINKQGLWFLTLFSLILVLSVYYITMPNEIFENEKIEEIEKNKSKEQTETKEVNSENTSYIETLKVELDSERSTILDTLQEVMSDSTKTSEEKNKAYEEMKEINDIKSKEETIVKKIKTEFKLDAYVKQEDNTVEIVIDNKKHDINLANKIMKKVQEEYDEDMIISVKFS